MQEYIIEIWHLISVSLNIKRAPPINTGLLRLLQLDENVCVCAIVSLFRRHMRVGYTQSENVERANESKESFKSVKQQ